MGYRVRQGFVSRNASGNMHGHVQGEVLLVPLISCWIEATHLPTLSSCKLWTCKHAEIMYTSLVHSPPATALFVLQVMIAVVDRVQG